MGVELEPLLITPLVLESFLTEVLVEGLILFLYVFEEGADGLLPIRVVELAGHAQLTAGLVNIIETSVTDLFIANALLVGVVVSQLQLF